MNIQFSYLYRDGANYKQFHSVVFANTENLSIEEIERRIRLSLIDEMWFYADKWKLEDLHHYKWDNEIDHTWHEYESIEPTEAEVTNGDIADFLQHIELHPIK